MSMGRIKKEDQSWGEDEGVRGESPDARKERERAAKDHDWIIMNK